MAAVQNARASFPSRARQSSMLRNSRANIPAFFVLPPSVMSDIALILQEYSVHLPPFPEDYKTCFTS